VGLAVVLGGWHLARGRRARPAAVVFDASTPLPVLTEGLRTGDARALLILFPRLAARSQPTPQPASDAEAEELIEVLEGLRTGFLRFGEYGRVSSMMLVTKILERFAVEEAPAHWFRALRPVHDLFASGLADADAQTRIAALNAVGPFWSWFPGRSMIPLEESTLVHWKEALYGPVVRRLGDREPQSRAAAVACLGLLPDDQAIVQANVLAYLEDRSAGGVLVRKQVLASFAHRPALLTEDLILKQLQDHDPEIAEMSEILLKTRGLTAEQIELGRVIFDPKPEHRASVIPRLRNRTDIDPVVWLLQLSHDSSDLVRADAVAALAERPTPEVLKRLAAMASTDPSPSVRQAAQRRVPAGSGTGTATASPIPMPKPRIPHSADSLPARPEATVALPPLPGSPSLNPKAN
jgi:HEAT repeat protein